MTAQNSSVDIIPESHLWPAAVQNDLLTHSISAHSFLLPKHPNYAAVSFNLVLADDATIQELNAEWRNKDQPTNVLAFPAAAMPKGMESYAHTLGDVIMAFETAQKEADDLNIETTEHATHLMIHGLLHLLGHDHLVDSERLQMESWEIRTLAELGYTNPYE